jgi:DNA-binding NarL/FixJ family response regulator
MEGKVPIRVVIAEDHTLVREGTRNILEQSRDIRVVGEAADGAEVVRLVEQLVPDVLLIDIGLPEISGIEATRQIKARHPAIAVLGLTAYDDDPYVFAMLNAGAAGYLMKNCRSTELVQAIRAVHSGETVLAPVVGCKVSVRPAAAQEQAAKISDEGSLTGREQEALLLVAKGLTNKAIARAMSLSPRTVQLHLAHIFQKMEVASRTEAVTSGLRRGWLRIEDIA